METGILRCCNSFCAAGCVGPRTDQCHVSAQFSVCVFVCVSVLCAYMCTCMCIHVCVCGMSMVIYVCVCVHVKRERALSGCFHGVFLFQYIITISKHCAGYFTKHNTYLVFPKIIFLSLDS